MNTNNEEDIVTPEIQTEVPVEVTEPINNPSILEINVHDNVLGKSVGPGGN